MGEQQKIQDVLGSINGQKIEFGFRKMDPNSRGVKTLKSVADGMSFLPDYAIRLEGYSNLVVREEKLTGKDMDQIHKLGKGRADACAFLLRAAGVQNDITCIGQGALVGAKIGCVRITVFPAHQQGLSMHSEMVSISSPKSVSGDLEEESLDSATPPQEGLLLKAVLSDFEEAEFETDLPSLLRPRKDGLTFMQCAAQKKQDLKMSSAPFIAHTQKADAAFLPPTLFGSLDL